MPGQNRFVTLDGMRGIAALVVAGSHVSVMLGLGVPPHGHLAVDFFFVLSGFVIAHAYEERLATTMEPAEFFLARVIRLHPLILLGSAVSIAVVSARGLGSETALAALSWAAVAGILMVPVHSLLSPAAFPLNGAAWSLFAEYSVNLVFAVIAVSLTRTRLCLLLVAGIAMLIALALGQAGLQSYWRADLVGLSLFRVVYPFFAGVFANRLFRSGKFTGPSLSPSLLIAVLLAILLAPPTISPTVFQFAMIVGVFPLLVFAGARDRLTETRSKWMLIGGRLSYPLYMLHFPLAVLLLPAVAQLLPPAAALVAFMLVLLAASWLALRYYDEPVRAWLSSWVRARRQRSVLV